MHIYTAAVAQCVGLINVLREVRGSIPAAGFPPVRWAQAVPRPGVRLSWVAMDETQRSCCVCYVRVKTKQCTPLKKISRVAVPAISHQAGVLPKS